MPLPLYITQQSTATPPKKAGLSSWRWTFILEGIATIRIGFAVCFLIADFPSEAKWLTEEERAFIVARTGILKKTKQSLAGQ